MARKMKAGFITIGQAPRPCIMESIRSILETTFDIIEAGALDEYSYEDICKYFPLCKEKDIFVTKLSDGKEIQINENYLVPLIQRSIDCLEKEGVELIVLMCTGDIGTFRSNVFFAESSEIVKAVTMALGKNSRVGIFIPDEKQLPQMIKRWEMVGIHADICPLSPYINKEETEKAVEKFKNNEWDLVLLDCMGYTEEMRHIIMKILRKKVLLSRSIVARVVCELG